MYFAVLEIVNCFICNNIAKINMKTIEEKIIYEIDKKGYSKAFIIKKLGMTATGFNQMLKNQSISLRRFTEIAKLLDLSPIYFFSNNPEDLKDFDINTSNNSSSNFSELKKENQFLKKQVYRLTYSLESISKAIIDNK